MKISFLYDLCHNLTYTMNTTISREPQNDQSRFVIYRGVVHTAVVSVGYA